MRRRSHPFFPEMAAQDLKKRNVSVIIIKNEKYTRIIMQYFKRYASNTTAGSASQLFFCPKDEKEELVGRIYYRLTAGGMHSYSFLYSNVTDSTFDHGDRSRCNRILPPWKIRSLLVGICKSADPNAHDGASFVPVTFGGAREKEVHAGEFFTTDPVTLSARAGDYLCIECTFCGACIPYHEERIIAAYRQVSGGWEDSALVPFPGMIGCDRAVDARVVFWGDSITQGIGTEKNSYTHWNARVAEALGNRYSYWNLGIGFGRATDAASLGAWFYKAKNCDLAVVCFGVNDILQTCNEPLIKESLTTAVNALRDAGVTVVLQTVPPFDYNEEQRAVWESVNSYIKETLAPLCAAVFDTVSVLGEPDAPHRARYGGHPDARGCDLWAEALTPTLAAVLDGLTK